MSTLLLSRSDVTLLIDPERLEREMTEAFIAYSAGRSLPTKRMPNRVGSGTAMVIAPGYVEGIPAYSVKVHAKFPEHPPAIKGVLLLHDLESGALLAVMDSSYLTAVRTGFCAALATHALARSDASTVAIIGAGVQGRFQLRYLASLRSLEHVNVFDVDPAHSRTFADEMSTEIGVEVGIKYTIEACVAGCGIIMAATWSTKPFLFLPMLDVGAHITTLGPDQPGKCEVDAGVIEKGVFFCDDRNLALEMGAIAGAGLDVTHIHAEIGEVLAGTKAGRTDARQITVYGSVGLAFQDLVVGWQIYQSAKTSGFDRAIDFLG